MISAVGLFRERRICPHSSTIFSTELQASRAARRMPFGKWVSMNIVLAQNRLAQGQTGVWNHRWSITAGAFDDAVSEAAQQRVDPDIARLEASLHLHPLRGGSKRLGTQYSTTRRAAIFNYVPHALEYLDTTQFAESG